MSFQICVLKNIKTKQPVTPPNEQTIKEVSASNLKAAKAVNKPTIILTADNKNTVIISGQIMEVKQVNLN